MSTALPFESKLGSFRDLEGEKEIANDSHEAMVGRVRVSGNSRYYNLPSLSEYPSACHSLQEYRQMDSLGEGS